MTAYVNCVECNTDVPWYYAWINGSDAMHPRCAGQRIDEEGCREIATGIRVNSWTNRGEWSWED